MNEPVTSLEDAAAREPAPLPTCTECDEPVTSSETHFPMNLEDGQRHLIEQSLPCKCITVDVPLTGVVVGEIGDDEDIDALAEAWHRVAAAAEWTDEDGDGKAAVIRLLEDAAAVAGIPHHLTESERVRIIAEHAERMP